MAAKVMFLEHIMGVGAPMGLFPGHTSSIRRIEGGCRLTVDVTLENNPFEIGMDRLGDLDMDAEFVSKKALTKIKQDGITQKQVGMVIDGEPLIGSNDEKWPVTVNGARVGMITSAIHSPRLEQNIALALVAIDHADLGQAVQIEMGSERRSATIVEKPFFDPKKEITAKASLLNARDHHSTSLANANAHGGERILTVMAAKLFCCGHDETCA